MMKIGKQQLIVFSFICCFCGSLSAQNKAESNKALTTKQQCIVPIAALTANGDLQELKPALNKGLDAGLTVNEIKEILVHLYAYCGFPRSIRGLQTCMEVLEERKAKGIDDETGADASPISDEPGKYERGKKNLEELLKRPITGPPSGYAAFAPVIEVFLKEHLFADIFDRDVLTFAERELVTISVLSSIGGAEPMLRSHLSICLNVGITPEQLDEFVGIIQSTIGKEEAQTAKDVLTEVLFADCSMEKKTDETIVQSEPLFPKGEIISSSNFTGTVWLHMMGANDPTLHARFGNVTFEPKARTNWHAHPGGQVLFITEGQGSYQAKGDPARVLRKGDFLEIPPNVVHWHGAGPEKEFAHIAISLNTDQGGVVWLEPVTDEEYAIANVSY
ncbi:MAG: carboxymuconolactone decarboxylase family protein [Bacteroidota bacterium]